MSANFFLTFKGVGHTIYFSGKVYGRFCKIPEERKECDIYGTETGKLIYQ